MALTVLREHGFDTSGLRLKSWTEFSGPDAAKIDLIITVCDNAAGESCPVWPVRPIAARWGIKDPAAVEGEGQHAAFETALHYLNNGSRCCWLCVARPWKNWNCECALPRSERARVLRAKPARL